LTNQRGGDVPVEVIVDSVFIGTLPIGWRYMTVDEAPGGPPNVGLIT
jgi:hypothetical protein